MKSRVLFIEILTWISFLLSIVGIVFYYLGYDAITFICAGISLVHSFINVCWGDQNGFVTEILTLIVGSLVAVIFKCEFWACLAVAICYGDVVFTLPGFISTICMYLKFFVLRR